MPEKAFIDCTVECHKCGVIGDHMTESRAEALAVEHEHSKGKGEHEVWWHFNYKEGNDDG
jgi:hypothetical protein